VGLGLADDKDITVKGMEVVKKATRVYLEAYTAVLLVEKDVLVSSGPEDWLRQLLIVTTVGSLLWPRSHHSRPRDGRIIKRRHSQRCRQSRCRLPRCRRSIRVRMLFHNTPLMSNHMTEPQHTPTLSSVPVNSLSPPAPFPMPAS
jgi:hypothetical protein